jgi:hypothetical protein
MAVIYYPLDDYWTKLQIEGTVYTFGALAVALFFQGVLSIAFVKTKASEEQKQSIISLYNKIPDAIIML